MAATADELEEELDDPISFVPVEDTKINTCNTDTTPAIIDVEESTDDESTDDESSYISSYGKNELVLPVTFFNISRNVRLLNKCKAMCIKIVDCKQHPTYYSRYTREEDISKSVASFPEVDRKGVDIFENKPINAEDTVVHASKITDKFDKHNSEKKHGEMFYEKLKRRKEQKKQIALNSKNLTQVDFKRNKGLIGLKITGNIFKQILNTEKALVKTKSNIVENNTKRKSESNAIKDKSDEHISDKTNKKPVETELIKAKIKLLENKPKEKYECDTGNGSVKMNLHKYNAKEKPKTNTENVLLTTKSNSPDDKIREKSANDTGKVLGKSKDKDKKNLETDTENKGNMSVIMKRNPEDSKEKKEIDSGITLAKNKSKPPEDKSKKKCGNKYMKQIGAVLDCLGTSVILIENTNKHVPKNIKINGGTDHTSAKAAGLPYVIDKTENIENSQMRCSIKVSTDNIIEKVFKHKKAKCDSRDTPNSQPTPSKIVEQKLKEIISIDDKKVPKLSLLRNNETKNFYVSSYKEKVQCKGAKNTDAGKSDELKQDDEVIVNKDTHNTRTQEGSNSPVIPCTTLNVPRANIPPNVYSKESSTSNQINTNNSKLVECNFANKNPLLTRLTDIKSHDSANNITNGNENRFSEQNIANANPPEGGTLIKMQIKPPSSENAPIVTHQTVTGLIRNKNKLNLPMNQPAFKRPLYTGNNAIILRKQPPSIQLQNSMFPMQGRPIQTVINSRPQYQPKPMGARSIRCQVAPRYPPPNNYNINYAQPRCMNPNIFSNFRMPSASAVGGMGMGANYCGPQRPGYPTGYRFPPPPPPPGPPPQDNLKNNLGILGPPTATVQHVSKDSIIGSTNTGEPIKKINIIARPAQTATDKEMMLAELNNAMMSPELTTKKPEEKQSNDLKSNTDPRSSKPCPLSKKNTNANINTQLLNIPEKPAPKVGYSPPILPILTYEETLEIFSQNSKHMKKVVSATDQCNNLFKVNTKNSELNIKKPDNKLKRKILHSEIGHEKAKKISYADYKKRVTKNDSIDVNKIRKYNESKNPTDDYNLDQGYDSDSTVKL